MAAQLDYDCRCGFRYLLWERKICGVLGFVLFRFSPASFLNTCAEQKVKFE